MKYTGTAVRDYEMAKGETQIVTLGIATWGKLHKEIKPQLLDAIDRERRGDEMVRYYYNDDGHNPISKSY